MVVHRNHFATIPAAEFYLHTPDGARVACFRWDAHGEVRGIVQIAHGMGEHIGRYSETIDALVAAGFTVYANDHRGHGLTAASMDWLGDLGPGGFDSLVADMYELSRIAWNDYPEEPFFLLGHSMGSFAAQQYALEHSYQIHGLILSGSGALDGLARLAASAPPGVNILNAPFEPARTPFDWLSRDTAIVDAFIKDPLCFAQLRAPSLASFLAAAPRLADPERLRGIRSELPVLIFSGSDDPVGQHLEGVQTLIDRYRQAGVQTISQDFYPGGRHEMLNETCRDAVRSSLLRWINRVLHRLEPHGAVETRSAQTGQRQEPKTPSSSPAFSSSEFSVLW
jgi:alpha-beta hydrolase superfamily lysophospholipase